MNRKATSTKDADPDLFQHHGIAGNGDSRGEARSHSTGKWKPRKPVACGHAHHARHRATESNRGVSFSFALLSPFGIIAFSHFAVPCFCSFSVSLLSLFASSSPFCFYTVLSLEPTYTWYRDVEWRFGGNKPRDPRCISGSNRAPKGKNERSTEKRPRLMLIHHRTWNLGTAWK